MRRPLLYALLALLTALAACGGEPGGERLAGADGATREAGTARFSVSQAHRGGVTGDYRLAGVGELDLAAGRGRVRLAPVAIASIGGPPGGIGETGLAASFETVYERDSVYVRAAVLEAPTTWVRLGRGDRDGALAQDFSADLSRSLAFLAGAGDQVQEAGREQVRGVPTTRYRFTADLQAAAAATEGDAAAWLRDQIADRGVNRLPCEAWLDDDGRLRRLRYTLDLDQSPTAGTATGSAEVETTVEYYDFGRPVDVAPPPADQVTDLDALTGDG